MEQYTDLFVRDNFGDTGQQPTLDASVSFSPDIIPYGLDTLTQQQLIDQYGPPLLNKTLQNNQVNHIYVRAKNLYQGASSGQIYLYYAPANLLVNVSAWSQNRVVNANGTFGANISATQYNQVAPGDQPFQFNPPISLGTHFCFLAQVSTQMHPNPLPSTNFNSWDEFVYWIRYNANIAWHNSDIVNTLMPQGYINNLVFQNLNDQDQFYGFQTRYKGVPKGSVLRLWAEPNTTLGFRGFDTGPVTVGDRPDGSFGQGAVFPAGYQTTVNTTCSFPGGPTTPPPGVAINTDSIGYVQNSAEERYRPLRDIMRSPSHVRVDERHSFDTTYGLHAAGALVPITTFSVLFNPDGYGA